MIHRLVSMADSLAGLALGAGSGERMRPLSILRPKVLCPVADVALIDHAIERLRSVTDDVAVNAHESQPTLVAHVADRVRVSVEHGEALGTAGAVAPLLDWIDGRALVVVNGDTWCPGGLDQLCDGWDGRTTRVLVPGGGAFGPTSPVAGALMAWETIRDLQPEPAGLWEVRWRQAHAEGRVEAIAHHGAFVDCGDPADYLRANLLAAGGSVIGAGAKVAGTVEDSVVWPGAVVRASEHLRMAIRTDAGTTVLVRRSAFSDRPRPDADEVR